MNGRLGILAENINYTAYANTRYAFASVPGSPHVHIENQKKKGSKLLKAGRALNVRTWFFVVHDYKFGIFFIFPVMMTRSIQLKVQQKYSFTQKVLQ